MYKIWIRVFVIHRNNTDDYDWWKMSLKMDPIKENEDISRHNKFVQIACKSFYVSLILSPSTGLVLTTFEGELQFIEQKQVHC